jgi:UDP-N-acetylglucosamine 2-epimerase (non-hydrolysing)
MVSQGAFVGQKAEVVTAPLKVLSIIGTRPEAIKMAPLIRLLQSEQGIASQVLVTGQHRQMLDQVMKLFDIKPDFDFDLMQPGQTPTGVAAEVMRCLESVLKDIRPDWVLVQGDTTTVMAAAIAAFYARVPVGHVEAGLRTFDRYQPFPEEINRRIASAVCSRHFAPTVRARENLLSEGVSPSEILVTGNTVIDALHWVANKPFQFGNLIDHPDDRLLEALGDQEKRIILVTAHRRENFGAPFERICAALRTFAEQYPDQVQIIYPVHLNPNIQEPARRLLGNVPNISLLPPLDYLPLIHVMKRAYFVITDSGGIQEEAPGLGKPVIVLREVTERPEAVNAGTVCLAGSDPTLIVQQAVQLMEDNQTYRKMAQAVNPYGDGRASRRIVDSLLGRAIEDFVTN